ncbi:hypothetical protein [Geminisphaera colitermitum]|uniref:hypothetical protein n=1 Tax=Geminisphaera colitermitum TaxID=1148786 RepID=UPI0022B7DFD9|nr:hypothetical protein [Geminisphaera colitermitum]
MTSLPPPPPPIARQSMRSIFLFSGFIGFTVVALAGLTAGRDPDLVLRDAAIGCLAGALVGRWFWSVLVSAMRETLLAQRQTQPLLPPPPLRRRRRRVLRCVRRRPFVPAD